MNSLEPGTILYKVSTYYFAVPTLFWTEIVGRTPKGNLIVIENGDGRRRTLRRKMDEWDLKSSKYHPTPEEAVADYVRWREISLAQSKKNVAEAEKELKYIKETGVKRAV